MDWCLIAAADPSWLEWTVNILKVALGLGMVIFVHELGHFVVAKLSGVKCEKFYLGFDIAGLKLAKFTWGETEYGIGILPLGGYVKMLGQEDNPARLREEIERAKAGEQSPPATQLPRDEAAGAGRETEGPADLEAARRALYDPRSYLAKSVPTRMAIISAGVIMNVIFAFFFAIGAYAIGVQQIAPIVGGVTPGDGAWQAGLEVGDRIVQIGEKPIHTFMDLKSAISLGDTQDGVAMVVQRPGQGEPFRVVAEAKRTGLAPTVGVGLPMTTALSEQLPVYPGSPAAEAKPGFEPGDLVIALDGEPVHQYADIHRHLARHREETLRVTVERSVSPEELGGASEGRTKQLSIEVPPAPMRRLGLAMEMGPITALQAGSPAATAGVQSGDVLLEVNGEPAGDPLTLPDRLRALAQEQDQVTLSLRRKGLAEPVEIEVPLRRTDRYDAIVPPTSPVSAPALGLAYEVANRVAAVLPGSPAERAGLKPGDAIARATLIPPAKEALERDGLDQLVAEMPLESITADLKAGTHTWPFFFELLQRALPGSKAQLQLASGRQVTMEPVESKDWFNPDRGFLFEIQEIQRRAESFGDAIRLGLKETVDALTMVFRTVQRLLDNQVSPKALSGPVGIAQMAYHSAARGTGELLIFLTILSANLAVLNFLPIPVLDGGHLVFLAYEGVTGKPPSERVQLVLTYMGLLLLLGLMIWVLGLDVGLISRD